MRASYFFDCTMLLSIFDQFSIIYFAFQYAFVRYVVPFIFASSMLGLSIFWFSYFVTSMIHHPYFATSISYIRLIFLLRYFITRYFSFDILTHAVFRFLYTVLFHKMHNQYFVIWDFIRRYHFALSIF